MLPTNGEARTHWQLVDRRDATLKSTMIAAVLVLLGCAAAAATAQSPAPIWTEVDAVYAEADALYRELHQNPELSKREHRTAARLAAGLKQLGYEVTTDVGGAGVVAVLRNGAGPTIMLRTDLDALPVTEATGLPFASTVRVKDDSGADVGVMHACGHDAHMAAWMATARIMASARDRWRGTLVLIGQPAEEIGAGARAMLADGLFTRFPKPDYALAVHDDPRLVAGVIGYRAGPILSNSTSLNITVFGRGGHGARPETTIDPIVIAARIVVALQTIVAREISPFDPAVITVGTIHGGTKNNIIPDEVKLQLTVRAFTEPVRAQLLAAIARVAKGEAAAGGAPRDPLIENVASSGELVNDPALTEMVRAVLVRDIGKERVQDAPAEMVSEDFALFREAGVPSLMLRIGATEKSLHEAAMKGGPAYPSLHSAQFAPDRVPTIKAAIAAEVVALRALMPR